MYCNKMVRKLWRKQKKTKTGTGTPHIENGSDDPVEYDDSKANVGCDPPRSCERRTHVGDLTPVKCEDSHGHAVCDSEQLINNTIVGSYPAYPGEVRESSKEIRR